MLDPSIFRRYDIRGVAGVQLTEEVAHQVGRALGTRIRRSGGTTAAVGRDVRHSSPGLAAEAAAGLASAGLEVWDLGQVPTPVLYHALHRRSLGGGIMVTGSHNPVEDNGLKLCLGTTPLCGDAVASLRNQVETGDLLAGSGVIRPMDHLSSYLDEITSLFHFQQTWRVAVDCGNGVMGPVVVEALPRLGVEVEPLYCEPDGDFPNHLPDPEVPRYLEVLGQRVRAGGAACGLGFDGDGDRLGLLDENGRKISADWLVILFSREMLAHYPGGKIRFDVKCSDFVAEDVLAHGGVPIMGETGHSLLKRDVRFHDALLGGELSGHIVFNRDYLPIDDSLYCALRFLRLLDASAGVVSSLFSGFPELVSTPEIKIPCEDAVKFEVVAGLVQHFRRHHQVCDLDGARVHLPEAWFLVRASNTTPNLTVRLEARSVEALRQARDRLLAGLRNHHLPEAERLLQEVGNA